MGNAIPHGDRLHECSPTCPEGDRREVSAIRTDVQKPNLCVREGDQGLPVPNEETSCQERFMDRVDRDMPARMELGLARYGTLLQPFNGRDFMRDTFEELMDLSVYLEGVNAEREAMLDILYDVATGGPEVVERATLLLLRMGQSLDLSGLKEGRA